MTARHDDVRFTIKGYGDLELLKKSVGHCLLQLHPQDVLFYSSFVRAMLYGTGVPVVLEE